MQAYIVRQPILDHNHEVIGYEILHQEVTESGSAKERLDSNTASAVESFLTQFDNDSFLNGKKAFITFTPNLLTKGVPRIFSTSKLIIQIDDDTIIQPTAQKLVYDYKKAGYKVAINGFEFALRYFSILDIVDIVKVNFAFDNESIPSIISMAINFNKEVIAYNINDEKSYNYALSLGCKNMQGTYVAEKLPSAFSKLNHMKSNFFQLMIAATKDDPEIDEIEEIISRDVTLTFSLLKIVNSAYFALRNQAKSAKQALIILGLGQLRQWIYLLSFKQEDGSMPEELIRLSFLRAKFCSETILLLKDAPISKSEAYLMGMFSTLGNLMGVPLEEALVELPISDEVKNALIGQKGVCGSFYNMVLAYEKGDWRTTKQLGEELDVNFNEFSKMYFECVEDVDNVWNSLMKSTDAVE